MSSGRHNRPWSTRGGSLMSQPRSRSSASPHLPSYGHSLVRTARVEASNCRSSVAGFD
jgi:hypothetical protein